MSVQSMPTPPILPEIPLVPPPQTAAGTLQDTGLSQVTSIQMSSDMVPFDSDRLELVSVWNSGDLDGSAIFPGYTTIGSEAAVIPPPREYALLSSTFHDIDFEIVLYAVKPPDTTGRILIREYPDSLMHDDNKQGSWSDNDLIQSYKHFWDVGVTPVYSFKLTPPSFMPHRLTHTSSQTPYDAFMSSCFTMEWLTPYMPGSIYPSNFNIYVFTRWNLKTYIPMLPFIIDTDGLTWVNADGNPT